MTQIAQVRDANEIEIVRALLREYEQAIGVDLCFQGFQAELSGLPGSYAPPNGRLLLAQQDEVALGCVALQGVDGTRAEMKRLYMRPAARGRGLGRLLVTKVLEEAEAIGYVEVVLDTLPTMAIAQHLYQQLGFVEIQPYRPNPIIGTRYLSKRLR